MAVNLIIAVLVALLLIEAWAAWAEWIMLDDQQEDE